MKCFVSFKKEDSYYKNELVKLFSKEDIIDGIPKEVLAQALKIVINSIYGKLGKLVHCSV